MRRELIPSFVSIPFALGLLVSLSSIARSGVNANGYLLLHTDDTVVYSEDDEATYCDMLSLECPFDPECDDDHSGCAMALDDLEPTSGRGPDPAVIWVIAAFPESSCPRVSAVQFGLSWPYEVELGFVGYGNCADFEIATDGWPTDLGSGTAITYGNAVRRTGFPVYWFAAYSYYGPIEVSIANFTTGPAAFADDSVPSILDNIPREHWGVVGLNGATGQNPYIDEGPYGACCVPGGWCEVAFEEECDGVFMGDGTDCSPDPCYDLPGACCFDGGSCQIGHRQSCERFGGVFQGGATECDPNPCPQGPGACCLPDGSCIIREQLQCGGEYLGPDTTCEPNPCPIPAGACCFATGECTLQEQTACESGGGAWQGWDSNCDPNPCPQPTGACCFWDGFCVEGTETDCEDLGGQFMGSDLPCDPNPCNVTPTEESSWGRVKALFRR